MEIGEPQKSTTITAALYYPSIFYTDYTFKGRRGIPAAIGQEAGYTLYSLPVHDRVNTEKKIYKYMLTPTINEELLIKLKCFILNCGGNLERTYARTETADKLHKERPQGRFKLGIVML